MIVESRFEKLVDVLLAQKKIAQDFAVRFRNLSDFDFEKKAKVEGRLSDHEITSAYSKLYNLPIVSIKDRNISKEVLNYIPEKLAKEYKIIAYNLEEGAVYVAVAEPHRLTSNLQGVLTELEKQKNLKIKLAITTLDDFDVCIKEYQKEEPQPKIEPLETKPVPVRYAANAKAIDLDKITIPYDVITKFPEDIARKYKMVVFEVPHPSLIKVAIADPNDKKIREILDFIREKNDIAIEEFQATPGQIHTTISRFYRKPEPLKPQSELMQKEVLPQAAPPISEAAEEILKPKEEKLEQNVGTRQFELRPKPTVEQPPKLEEEEQQPTFGTDEEETPEVKENKISQQQLVVAPEENDLDQFLGQDVKSVDDLQAIAETSHVPKIVAAAIALAVLKKASDIHIEPCETNVRIRFRVDGILKDIIKLPLSQEPAIISRIKILSKLKIDETRVPQDGRFDVKTQGHEIDLRISTLPTVHGEKAAMRILDKSAHLYTLEELGLSGNSLKVIIDNIAKPYGVILSTGPTGSGKTTTLYAILNRISNPSVNIITLEDPVEYEMPGINQCQIKPKIGFTFANGLRSVLRQDPNIIMVGEIRDSETASLATHAALTGHLVLSTLHTNDASGALPRIVNMGVEPFLITSSINAIIAQRLVRKLCPKCVHPAEIPAPIMEEIESELKDLNLPTPYQFLEGKGCSECDNGYKGRIGIFEVLSMTDKVEALVIANKPSSEIKAEAIREGMITMKRDGLTKALKGQTTVNEVLRAVTI